MLMTVYEKVTVMMLMARYKKIPTVEAGILLFYKLLKNGSGFGFQYLECEFTVFNDLWRKLFQPLLNLDRFALSGVSFQKFY